MAQVHSLEMTSFWVGVGVEEGVGYEEANHYTNINNHVEMLNLNMTEHDCSFH